MTFAPNTFLIGAMKAGTTSMAGLLDQHPEICVSRPKETHYYSRDGSMGNDRYKSLFARPDASVTIDASVTYSMLPFRAEGGEPWRHGVHERIFDARSDARFIYIMRDPIERAWSAWNHELQTGRQQYDFAGALAQKESMLIDNGDYLAQIEAWLRFYPIERFRFYEFKAFLKDPIAATKGVIDWLGLPPFAEEPVAEHLNEKMAMSGFGRTVTRVVLETPALAKLRGSVPRSLRQTVRSLMSSGTLPEKEIAPETAELFQQELAPSWPRLAELTGVDLSHWGAASDVSSRDPVEA